MRVSTIGAMGGICAAELPAGPQAPALDVAAVEDGAGMVAAGRDRDGGSPGTEVDRKDGWLNEWVAVALPSVGRRAVAELSVVIPSPALEQAVVEDGTGMVIAD